MLTKRAIEIHYHPTFTALTLLSPVRGSRNLELLFPLRPYGKKRGERKKGEEVSYDTVSANRPANFHHPNGVSVEEAAPSQPGVGLEIPPPWPTSLGSRSFNVMMTAKC